MRRPPSLTVSSSASASSASASSGPASPRPWLVVGIAVAGLPLDASSGPASPGPWLEPLESRTFLSAAAGPSAPEPPPPVPSAAELDASGSVADVLVSVPTQPTRGYLKTLGNQIVDQQNNPVRLTGINWFGFETGNRVLHGLWSRGYRSVLDQVKSLGFNTLRIPYSNAMLRSDATTNSLNFHANPDLQGLSPLQCLDKVIDYCGQIGLRVILDRHSSRADNFANEDLWYIPGDGYYTEQRWIADWVMLANRYAGNPTVIGADLFNEPKRTATWGNSSPATDWNHAAARAGNAILAANPDWLIIVEGVERFANQNYWWGGNLKGAAAFPVVLNVPDRLVYSTHDYPQSLFNQTWFTAPDYPNNLDTVWDSHWGYLFRTNTAPILLGEFGTKLQTTSDRQWLDKLTDYVDGDLDLDGTRDLPAGRKGMSFTFWCLNPNSGDTGGILNDDWTTVNQAKLGYLSPSLEPLLPNGPAVSATFTVTLASPQTQPVTIAFATRDDTARAGRNYVATSGTLTFAPGQTSRTVSVPVLFDPQQRTSLRFTLQLTPPAGLSLARGTAVATLYDRTPPTHAGDLNDDGIVNNQDIAPFVTALTDPAAFQARFGYPAGAAGDVNRDGVVNNQDIAPFLALLTGGRPGIPVRPPVPAAETRPASLSLVRWPGLAGGSEPLFGRAAITVLPV